MYLLQQEKEIYSLTSFAFTPHLEFLSDNFYLEDSKSAFDFIHELYNFSSIIKMNKDALGDVFGHINDLQSNTEKQNYPSFTPNKAEENWRRRRSKRSITGTA
jgi:hypothetical protein